MSTDITPNLIYVLKRTPAELTWQGDIDTKRLQNMQDIDADIDDAGGNLDGAVLHALDIRDELVEVVDDGLRLGPRQVGQGGDDREVRVDDVLQLIQNQVDRGRNRCDKNKAWLVGAISRLVKGFTKCLHACRS